MIPDVIYTSVVGETLPIAVLVLSAAGFGYSILSGRRQQFEHFEKAQESRIQMVTSELASVKAERDALRKERDELLMLLRAKERENVDLLRRIYKLENGGT